MTSNSTNLDPLLPEEDLVAYLDGELDEETCRRIEELLATKPEARLTLQRLEKTWDVLDELERAEVVEKNVCTTLELVALEAEEEAEQYLSNKPRRRLKKWLLTSASLLFVSVAGFLFVSFFWPNPNQQLLQNLPVLEKLDYYSQVGDIEFLRELHQKKLFTEETADESP